VKLHHIIYLKAETYERGESGNPDFPPLGMQAASNRHFKEGGIPTGGDGNTNLSQTAKSIWGDGFYFTLYKTARFI
jgi:hypothetical protein